MTALTAENINTYSRKRSFLIPYSLQKILRPSFVCLALLASKFLVAKTALTPETVCSQYKNQYLSYASTGPDLFYVTSHCTRKVLDEKETQAALADKTRQIYAVEEAVIALLPREAEQKDSALDFIKEHKGHCVSALDGQVWEVTGRGLRLIPDFATVNAKCPKVYDVDENKLSSLGLEKKPVPSVYDSLYNREQTKEPVAKLKAHEVCAQLKVGELYFHASEFYKLAKQNKVCYLQKISAEQLSDLMTKLNKSPVQLTVSQYISLDKSAVREK